MKALFAATAIGLLAAGGVQAKTLVYCSEGSPEGFDPAPWTAGTTFDAASRTIYNRLIEFKKGSTETEPGLAESWETSEDGTEITFKLRQGVKFQTTDFFTPTRDMNADDVVFSFQRQFDKEGAWYEYAPGIAWEYFNSTMAASLKEIVKVDDSTVKFVLSQPDATFLATFPMDFASIVSKEYADQLEAAGTMEQFNVLPVGTGAFTFVDYQQDAVIRYQAFADYWDGKQPIDDLIFAITVDPGVRMQKLLAGECDIFPYPNPADIETLKGNADLTVMQQEGFNVGYLAYNTTQAPFDNPAVRRALNKAINKEAIIDAVFQGTGAGRASPTSAASVS
jgi:dipeptide transport system substrate-binding protein